MEVSTVLLKMCVEAGLNLHEIATVMTRPFGDTDEEPSELERICMSACQAVDVSSSLSVRSLVHGEKLFEKSVTYHFCIPASPCSWLTSCRRT